MVYLTFQIFQRLSYWFGLKYINQNFYFFRIALKLIMTFLTDFYYFAVCSYLYVPEVTPVNANESYTGNISNRRDPTAGETWLYVHHEQLFKT